jgi:hypothetical protein
MTESPRVQSTEETYDKDPVNAADVSEIEIAALAVVSLRVVTFCVESQAVCVVKTTFIYQLKGTRYIFATQEHARPCCSGTCTPKCVHRKNESPQNVGRVVSIHRQVFFQRATVIFSMTETGLTNCKEIDDLGR